MAHILAAQQIWLNRCMYLSPAPVNLWESGEIDADAFQNLAIENHAAWINYLNSLTETSFDEVITYKNSKGEPFSSKLVDILSHLINHGTHHRAQIGQQLKFAGLAEIPLTDYIFYIRQKNQ